MPWLQKLLDGAPKPSSGLTVSSTRSARQVVPGNNRIKGPQKPTPGPDDAAAKKRQEDYAKKAKDAYRGVRGRCVCMLCICTACRLPASCLTLCMCFRLLRSSSV